jgi:hypothetical protein
LLLLSLNLYATAVAAVKERFFQEIQLEVLHRKVCLNLTSWRNQEVSRQGAGRSSLRIRVDTGALLPLTSQRVREGMIAQLQDYPLAVVF